MIDRLGQAALRLQTRAQTCDDASLGDVADLLMEVAVKLEAERLEMQILELFESALRNDEVPADHRVAPLLRELNEVREAFRGYNTAVQPSAKSAVVHMMERYCS